jgi:hypothetical protein
MFVKLEVALDENIDCFCSSKVDGQPHPFPRVMRVNRGAYCFGLYKSPRYPRPRESCFQTPQIHNSHWGSLLHNPRHLHAFLLLTTLRSGAWNEHTAFVLPNIDIERDLTFRTPNLRSSSRQSRGLKYALCLRSWDRDP